MIHKQRRYRVTVVDSVHELARMLTRHTWCACSGFRLAGTSLVFLNDAFSADGAQEYAVFNVEKPGQLESITFSWCTEQEAQNAIARLKDAPPEPFSPEPCPSLEHPAGACSRCA